MASPLEGLGLGSASACGGSPGASSLRRLSLTDRGVIFARIAAASAASRSAFFFALLASTRSIAASRMACACFDASRTAGVTDASHAGAPRRKRRPSRVAPRLGRRTTWRTRTSTSWPSRRRREGSNPTRLVAAVTYFLLQKLLDASGHLQRGIRENRSRFGNRPGEDKRRRRLVDVGEPRDGSSRARP